MYLKKNVTIKKSRDAIKLQKLLAHMNIRKSAKGYPKLSQFRGQKSNVLGQTLNTGNTMI